MAEYTNLTSLEGLAVGDVITYDTTTAIDFKGYKVKVELYGQYAFRQYSQTTGGATAYGGYAAFVIETSKLPEKILKYNMDYCSLKSSSETLSTSADQMRNDLIYGNTDDLYYRIAVAGNAGRCAQSGTSAGADRAGGNGGGLTAAGGTTGTNMSAAKGGSQTTGGAAATASGDTTTNGSGGFGIAGTGYRQSSYRRGSDGGYGWYGGGGGTANTIGGTSGGGGSGFIIGTSTTTYPAGYLGDNTTLQNTIASSISDGVLTQGRSSETTPKMILTIVEVGSGGSTQSVMSYFNGTEFVPTTINYYNGSEFVVCDGYYYDGTEFKKI